MSAAGDLQQLLHRTIPLSLAMGTRVAHLDPQELVLHAPLQPNINHEQTGFGGSLSALAMLAGWGMVWALLHEAGRPGRIIIQSASSDFVRPCTGDFSARCQRPPTPAVERFLATLQRHGRARLDVTVEIHSGAKTAMTFAGRYAAFMEPAGDPQ